MIDPPEPFPTYLSDWFEGILEPDENTQDYEGDFAHDTERDLELENE